MAFELRNPRGTLTRLEVPATLRWKELGRARERYEAVREKVRQAGMRHEALRGQLATAQRVDLAKLGQALADDKPPPRPTAERIERELADANRNLSALDLELEARAAAVIDTVEANRARWHTDAVKDEQTAVRAYLAAVNALETATVELSARRSEVAWIRRWPDLKGSIGGSLGSLEKLTGRNGDPTPLPVVLDALRAVADPTQPSIPSALRGGEPVAA